MVHTSKRPVLTYRMSPPKRNLAEAGKANYFDWEPTVLRRNKERLTTDLNLKEMVSKLPSREFSMVQIMLSTGQWLWKLETSVQEC